MKNFEQIKQTLPDTKKKLLDLSEKRRLAIESGNNEEFFAILKEEGGHIEKLLQQINQFMKFYKTMKKLAGGKLKNFEGVYNEFEGDVNFMKAKKELISQNIRDFEECKIVDLKVFNEKIKFLEEKYSSLQKYTTEEIKKIEKNITK